MSYFTIKDKDTATSEFIMFPKELLDEKYSHLDLETKFLYTLLLRRTSLSIKNKLADENGRIYVIYQQSEVQNELGLSKRKVQKMFQQLESNGLIERRKQMWNLPDMIFVVKMASHETKLSKLKQEVVNQPTTANGTTDVAIKKNYSGSAKNIPHRDARNAPPKVQKVSLRNDKKCTPGGIQNIPLSYTNLSYTEKREKESIYPSTHIDDLPTQDQQPKDKDSGLINIHTNRLLVINQIEAQAIDENLSENEKTILDSIISTMAEVYSRNHEKISVGGTLVPCDHVKDKLREINEFHVEYIIDCVSKRSKAEPIINMKSYLLTALVNAPQTIDSYYENLVAKPLQKVDNICYNHEINGMSKSYYDSLVV